MMGWVCDGARWVRTTTSYLTTTHAHTPDTHKIWIDLFAVRQWPGNGADLNFRGVVAGCTAAIVAAAPIEGKLLKDGHMALHSRKQAFLKSDEYAAAAKVLPFCRLWCVHTHTQPSPPPPHPTPT